MPSPAFQEAQRRAVGRIMAPLPRALAHSIKDALDRAYEAGWEDRGKDASTNSRG